MLILTILIGLTYDSTSLDQPIQQLTTQQGYEIMAWPLGQPDAKGMVPYELFGIPGKHGYIVSDQELYNRLKTQYYQRVLDWDFKYGRKQPILIDVRRKILILSWEQMTYFFILQLSCPQCYPVSTLTPGDPYSDKVLAEIQKQKDLKRLPADTNYNYKIDLHIDIHHYNPVIFESIATKGNDKLKIALFLEPWNLEYFVIYIPLLDPPSPKLEPIPFWVKMRLSFNEAWIKAAQRHLEGLTWDEYFRIHKCIPGDRSIPDMMYNRILNIRGVGSFEEYQRRLMPPPADPVEFAMDVFRAHYQEIEDANRMVDQWLEQPHRAIPVETLAKLKVKKLFGKSPISNESPEVQFEDVSPDHKLVNPGYPRRHTNEQVYNPLVKDKILFVYKVLLEKSGDCIMYLDQSMHPISESEIIQKAREAYPGYEPVVVFSLRMLSDKVIEEVLELKESVCYHG